MRKRVVHRRLRVLVRPEQLIPGKHPGCQPDPWTKCIRNAVAARSPPDAPVRDSIVLLFRRIFQNEERNIEALDLLYEMLRVFLDRLCVLFFGEQRMPASIAIRERKAAIFEVADGGVIGSPGVATKSTYSSLHVAGDLRR